MTSIRHNPGPDDSLLDAARHCLLAVGWKRTTLTDVARRSGVSRMTIYRRWPDMATLLSDLMTREWSGVVDELVLDMSAAPVDRLATGVTRTVAALRENELFGKIVHVDPELLLPYLLDRRGRSQDTVLTLLETAIVEGQNDGSVRKGDPVLLARTVLLTAHGFALSAETMTGETTSAKTTVASDRAAETTVEDLDGELRTLIERYLSA